jgi:hypothetical protein
MRSVRPVWLPQRNHVIGTFRTRLSGNSKNCDVVVTCSLKNLSTTADACATAFDAGSYPHEES